jgi:hypothetical protein
LTGVGAPSFFEENDICGVMRNAHRIRFRITDMKRGFRRKTLC